MKALIAINKQDINHKPIPTVSARELHRFMEVGKDFSTWIKDRIDEFGYESGRDFIVITGSPSLASDFSPNQGKSKMGRPPIEYHLTLDMAKELAMVERNPMGRVARKYFIKCEQAALEIVPKLQQALLAKNPLWDDLARYQAMGLTRKEICLLVGMCKDTVRRHFRQMEGCGLIAPPQDMAEMRKKAARMNSRQMSLFPVGALR